MCLSPETLQKPQCRTCPLYSKINRVFGCKLKVILLSKTLVISSISISALKAPQLYHHKMHIYLRYSGKWRRQIQSGSPVLVSATLHIQSWYVCLCWTPAHHFSGICFSVVATVNTLWILICKLTNFVCALGAFALKSSEEEGSKFPAQCLCDNGQFVFECPRS